MEAYTVITQHGKLKIKVEVEIDPALLKLGATPEKMEKKVLAILHSTFTSIGGKTTRPVKWDN